MQIGQAEQKAPAAALNTGSDSDSDSDSELRSGDREQKNRTEELKDFKDSKSAE